MKYLHLAVLAAILTLVAACGGGEPAPAEAASDPTPTPTVERSAPVATPTPTSVPEVVALEPTATPTPIPAPTATPTPTPIPMITSGKGVVFITEIMINPLAVDDIDGEWFEIYNPDPVNLVDINGWTIQRGGGSHVIDNGGPLTVGNQGFLVLGINGDYNLNGSVQVDYQYTTINMRDALAELRLKDADGRTVDEVEYTDSMVYDGASAQLNPDRFDAEANDSRSSWCRSSEPLPGSADTGTPGERNDKC